MKKLGCLIAVLIVLALVVGWKLWVSSNTREWARSVSPDGGYVCTVTDRPSLGGPDEIASLSANHWWSSEICREPVWQDSLPSPYMYEIEWEVKDGKTTAAIVKCVNRGKSPKPELTVRLSITGSTHRYLPNGETF